MSSDGKLQQIVLYRRTGITKRGQGKPYVNRKNQGNYNKGKGFKQPRHSGMGRQDTSPDVGAFLDVPVEKLRNVHKIG